MDLYTFLGLVTAVLMALFVGIVVWAYSSRRKPGFDEAARLPFEDECSTESQTNEHAERPR